MKFVSIYLKKPQFPQVPHLKRKRDENKPEVEKYRVLCENARPIYGLQNRSRTNRFIKSTELEIFSSSTGRRPESPCWTIRFFYDRGVIKSSFLGSKTMAPVETQFVEQRRKLKCKGFGNVD